MANQPLVTILINNYNYNYGRFVNQAIDSALNQDHENTEVVVVDDGSQDDSRKILSGYHDKIRTVLKENGGQGSAFNVGFDTSKGEIICFLDADDTFRSNKISQIVELFEAHPEAGWVFHELQDVDKDGNDMELKRQRATDELAVRDFRHTMTSGGLLPFMPATSGLSFRADLLRKVLPMPEEFRISADSFLRLASIFQAPGVLCPQRLSTHRIHGNNLFEFSADIARATAELEIRTAYYLRDRFPQIRSFANRSFSHAMGQLVGLTGPGSAFKFPEARKYIGTHLAMNPVAWVSCAPRMLLNYWRSRMRPDRTGASA